MNTDHTDSARPRLTRQRVIAAAVDLADRAGLDALTMRRLGAELGVEAMSLYKHVAGKDDILDGMVELVVGEIELPSDTAGWREAMKRRATSAREVLRRHSWAIGLLEARGLRGPATLRYLDGVLGALRAGGFSIEGAAHAFWLLDSYVYGHVIQETSLPLAGSAAMSESARSEPDRFTAGEYRHLGELTAHASRFEFSVDGEFRFGLDLILDALERVVASPLRGR